MREFFNCQACVDLLADYLEGTLDRDTKTRLDDHLAGCAPCVNFLRTYDKSAHMLQALREQKADVPLAVQSRLKSFLRKEFQTMLSSKTTELKK